MFGLGPEVGNRRVRMTKGIPLYQMVFKLVFSFKILYMTHFLLIVLVIWFLNFIRIVYRSFYVLFHNNYACSCPVFFLIVFYNLYFLYCQLCFFMYQICCSQYLIFQSDSSTGSSVVLSYFFISFRVSVPSTFIVVVLILLYLPSLPL